MTSTYDQIQTTLTQLWDSDNESFDDKSNVHKNSTPNIEYPLTQLSIENNDDDEVESNDNDDYDEVESNDNKNDDELESNDNDDNNDFENIMDIDNEDTILIRRVSDK